MKWLAWMTLFSLCFSCLQGDEFQRLEKQLSLQQSYGFGRWCLVPLKDKQLHAEILEIDKDCVTVRIFDGSLPLSEWPEKTFDLKDIEPMHKQHSKDLESMISDLKYTATIQSSEIENAFRKIDRAWFCPRYPYFDASVALSDGSSISSPHIYAWALELLKDSFPHAKSVLNVGSGTGYMLAIFSHLCPKAKITGIDVSESLAVKAEKLCISYLPKNQHNNIKVIVGQGELGHSKDAPFDIIYVDFMCESIPPNLVDQLALEGVMIIPIGNTVSSYDDQFLGGNL